MIFKKEHIEQIRKGIKTQTRRVNRGKYQIGKDYAVQPGRGELGIEGLRIIIDFYTEETQGYGIPITKQSAIAEGNYTPEEFEKKFRELNPKWNGLSRWVFVFHLGERIGE